MWVLGPLEARAGTPIREVDDDGRVAEAGRETARRLRIKDRVKKTHFEVTAGFRLPPRLVRLVVMSNIPRPPLGVRRAGCPQGGEESALGIASR